MARTLQADSFEDTAHNAISIGGSDTIGCVTSDIAKALYGISKDIREKGMSYQQKQFAESKILSKPHNVRSVRCKVCKK